MPGPPAGLVCGAIVSLQRAQPSRFGRAWRSWLAALALLPLLQPAPAASAEERVWLQVARPHDGWVELGLNSLLEVRGAAGSVGRGPLDLIVIVDVSRSTKHGAGVDVNGDGHLGGIGYGYRRDWGSYLRHPQTSSDAGDSILNAEILAVNRLLDTLDPKRTRVGIVSLRETALLHSSLGSSYDDHRRALANLAKETPSGRTDFAEAIRVATRELELPRYGTPYRQLGIVLLSDGKPTAPAPDDHAASEAVAAARAAHRRGVRIDTVSLGVSDQDSRALFDIATASKGIHTSLEEPGDIIEALPNLDLRGRAAVSMVNSTTRRRARAVRVWADGSFDGFIDLRPGKNRLVITARGPAGERTREVRYVYFAERDPVDARERLIENRKLERLRDFLRDRSVEVQLAGELEGRNASQKDLTVLPE